MIKQAAFVNDNRMLKGALHCHTTRSDGRVTPEEVMQLHKDNGYDFLAITDHRRYNYKDYMPNLGLTIIPGMEYNNVPTKPFKSGFRAFHTVCIGDVEGFEQDVLLNSAPADEQEEYQPYLDKFHEMGCLTFYCHPEWSSTPARYFDKMRGNFAMEIWNTGCVMSNDMDCDASYWDELLGMGNHIYGVATDDGHAREHHCKGWVMVNAENNVKSILEALKNGAFYSSTGPEIYDFRVEDNKAIIDCSPASKIRLHCDGHPTRIVRDENGALTHAEFDLACPSWMSGYAYVRITVIDKDGKHAWTNPIFLYD